MSAALPCQRSQHSLEFPVFLLQISRSSFSPASFLHQWHTTTREQLDLLSTVPTSLYIERVRNKRYSVPTPNHRTCVRLRMKGVLSSSLPYLLFIMTFSAVSCTFAISFHVSKLWLDNNTNTQAKATAIYFIIYLFSFLHVSSSMGSIF